MAGPAEEKAPEKREVSTLQQFTEIIEKQLAGSTLWYRGCGLSSHCLTPTLFRHPSVVAPQDLIQIEASILTRFKQRSVPYLASPLRDDWEYLFQMQHFGVPTRLLDWTENPYFALYFALTQAINLAKDGAGPAEPAAVWILDPTKWNKAALSYMGFKGGVLSLPDARLKGYAPGSPLDEMNEQPVAMYGTHNSPRIVAQRGVFTIFGKNNLAMDEAIKAFDEQGRSALVRLLIPQAAIPTLLTGLISIGFTESVLFPDLDGLAREIKRAHGYRV